MQMEMESDAIIHIMRIMDSSQVRLVRERAGKEGRQASSDCVQVNCTEPCARVHGPNVVRDRRSNCGGCWCGEGDSAQCRNREGALELRQIILRLHNPRTHATQIKIQRKRQSKITKKEETKLKESQINAKSEYKNRNLQRQNSFCKRQQKQC